MCVCVRFLGSEFRGGGGGAQAVQLEVEITMLPAGILVGGSYTK